MIADESSSGAAAGPSETTTMAMAPISSSSSAAAAVADSTFIQDDHESEDDDAPLLLGGPAGTPAEDKKRSRVAALRRKRRGGGGGGGTTTTTNAGSVAVAPDSALPRPSSTWTARSALLSLSLSVTLCSFWLLDSLKDPVFAALVGGDLRTHQPRAKLVSVAGQVGLVWLMETVLNERRRRRRRRKRGVAAAAGQQGRTEEGAIADDAEVRDGGGRWTRMTVGRDDRGRDDDDNDDDDGSSPPERIPAGVFRSIGIPYSVAFIVGGWMLRRHPSFSSVSSAAAASSASPASGDYAWRVLGYVLYLTIESYGSLSVAAFWSYANSTLSLSAAEAWYGTIVACAQLGAIGGSTLAARHAHEDSGEGGGELAGVPRLFLLSVGGIGLQMVVMAIYGHFFPHPMVEDGDAGAGARSSGRSSTGKIRKTVSFHRSIEDGDRGSPTLSTKTSQPSALNLILRHNYLLLILGVSCLYEVSLTCLDYQLKLIGLDRFGGEDAVGASVADLASGGGGSTAATPVGAAWALAATFSQFMGRFGQLTNGLSLLLSYFAFPWLMSRYGLRRTILLFPTLLIAVTLVTYLAVPLNLPVLFVSMSLLKALTYSVNDPSKEILYLTTSDDIKYRCKFWIDVVGARVAKAAGSSLNTYAGSAERIVRYGTVPSVATAAGLWLVCRAAGREFDRLVSAGEVVGAKDGEGGRGVAGEGEVEVDLSVDGTDPDHFELVGEEEEGGVGGLPIDDEEDGADGDVI